MCIAIVNQQHTIDEETFNTCWEHNPDGGGIAYIEDRQVKIMKEMRSASRMYSNYIKIRKHNALPMIIHFRIATSGSVDEDNCHPFQVSPDIVMAHNGILDHVKPTQAVNDTRVFIQEVLSELPGDFLYHTAIRRLISGFIGDSKLVFLDSYGMCHIINENLGHWDVQHNNWFSNYSYLAPSVPDELFLRERYRKPAGPATRNRYDGSGGQFDDWGVCEACENWAGYTGLEYDNYLNMMICGDCKSFYYGEQQP